MIKWFLIFAGCGLAGMLFTRLLWPEREAKFIQGRHVLFSGLVVIFGLLVALGTKLLTPLALELPLINDDTVFMLLSYLAIIHLWFVWKVIRHRSMSK